MDNEARVTHAKKNVMYSMITYVILMVLTLLSRKIVVSQLGDNVAGLEGLFREILNFLNLVESGVGIAIMFSLYKPFAEGDRTQIKSLLSMYSKVYKICGTIVLVAAVFITPFLKIFIKDNVNMLYVQGCFLLYIVDTVITYYFSYKICLLNASQNLYIVSFWDFVFKFMRAVMQILVLMKFKSFAAYIVVQIVTNILYLITINSIISKKFAWLKHEKVEEVKGKKQIIKNIKALFVHKIGAFVVFSTDNLLITSFLSLKISTVFMNYNMITTFCRNFMIKIFDALTASIGNLLVEANKEKAYDIFKKLFFFNFWISSFVTISLYNCIDSFIVVWISDKYLLSQSVVIVLLINFYIATMRLSVDKFKDSAGLYYEDRYAPICEAVINLVSSIILVRKMGLIGIFIGTLISNLSVIFWIKPKIVFNNIFHKSFFEYLAYYLRYICYSIVPFILTRISFKFISSDNSIINFLIRVILSIIIINLTYVVMFYKKTEFKYYKNLILKKILK